MTETPMQRAIECATVLLDFEKRTGKSWVPKLPHDASYRGEVVWLGGVKMRPITTGGARWWELTEGDRVVVVRPTVKGKAS